MIGLFITALTQSILDLVLRKKRNAKSEKIHPLKTFNKHR